MGRLRRVALGLNDKLSSPSLKTLRLMYIRNCPRLAFDKLGGPSLKTLRLLYVRKCPQLSFDKLLKMPSVVTGRVKLDIYISIHTYSLTKLTRPWKSSVAPKENLILSWAGMIIVIHILGLELIAAATQQ